MPVWTDRSAASASISAAKPSLPDGEGFAPFVALFLSSRFGLISSGAYLLSGALCTLLALFLVNRRLDMQAR